MDENNLNENNVTDETNENSETNFKTIISNAQSRKIIGGTDSDEDFFNFGTGSFVTILGGAGNDVVRNFARLVSIEGGEGDDTLTSYSSGNFATIDGGKGNDFIFAYGHETKGVGSVMLNVSPSQRNFNVNLDMTQLNLNVLQNLTKDALSYLNKNKYEESVLARYTGEFAIKANNVLYNNAAASNLNLGIDETYKSIIEKNLKKLQLNNTLEKVKEYWK